MSLRSVSAAVLVLGTLLASPAFADPVSSFIASPITGNAPLGVAFDATGSSQDAVSFTWDFGDGTGATGKTVTKVYLVAGTYIATLTVADAAGVTNSSQITITVAGSGEGPVATNTNFRWALNTVTFNVNHTPGTTRDKFYLTSTFNTVDLPAQLRGLSASFSINNVFTVNGILGEFGVFETPENRKPFSFVSVNTTEQTLIVEISRADLKAALAASGAGSITTPPGGAQVPVTFTLTIGAQTYTITENVNYTSVSGRAGRGEYSLSKRRGSIRDGFFVVSRASALENDEGTGHFFEFECFLSRPLQQLIQAPGTGSFRIVYNEADKEFLLFDRIKTNKTVVAFDQSDRDLRGTRRMTLESEGRRLILRTWDILADEKIGGTGLPLRGKPFTAFNFTLRLELDQPDGSTFEVVTATRLTRRTQDDAFWQTGRRNKRR